MLAANAGRLSTLIRVWGENPVFLGKDNTVTTQTGFPLHPADGLLADAISAADALWAISNGQGDIRVMEFLT